MITAKMTRPLDIYELYELAQFMECQEDEKKRMVDIKYMAIDGNYSVLGVSIDKEGNIITD